MIDANQAANRIKEAGIVAIIRGDFPADSLLELEDALDTRLQAGVATAHDGEHCGGVGR